MPFLILSTIFLFGGCSVLNQFSGNNTAVSATATPSPSPTPNPQIGTTPNPNEPSTPITETQTTITVWIAPEIYNTTEEGNVILQSQLQAFQNTHPEIILVSEPKAVTGQGSILNYLRTGKNIAPSVLPDVVAIPANQLSAGFNEGLLYSLNGSITSAELEDLYPAALDMALSNEQVRGYPFILTNLPHLAYNSTAYTETVTSSWDAFIELPNQKFAFPANGQAGATLALQFYLAAGGTLINEAGQQELQLDPLVTALKQLEKGKTNGFILAQSSNLNNLEDAWQLLLEESQGQNATIVQTASEQYLTERSDELPIGFQVIPGINRPLVPLVNGWVWAMSTSDPQKQQLASDLIHILIQSDNLAEWSSASQYLPSRRSSLNAWPTEDTYTAFAHQQLLQANLHPLTSSTKMMAALNNAVFDVVTLAKSPQEAAGEAILSLQE